MRNNPVTPSDIVHNYVLTRPGEWASEKRKRLPFPYGLRHITPLLRFLRPRRSDRSVFTLLPCVHGESLGRIIKHLPWDVRKLLHGYMLRCLRMESMKVSNGVLAVAQVSHWFPCVVAWSVSFPPD